MFWDLEGNRPTFTLIPHYNPDKAKDGCCVRQVESSNPVWYKSLIRKYPAERKKRKRYRKQKKIGSDTKVKRETILSVLRILSDGRESRSKYAPDLVDIAQKIFFQDSVLETEVEKYFWYSFSIILDKEIILFLENLGYEYWEDVALFYKKNHHFPEYLFEQPPF